MTEQDISALVIVNSEGNLVGLISRTDLVNARLYEQYWKNWARPDSQSHHDF